MESAPEASPRDSRFADRLRRACVGLGLVLSALLLWRSLPGGDQLGLLGRGWMLAARGDLLPYGNPLTGGGYEPGPATSVVVALPLLVWRDARAPALLLWATHLAAWLLLDRRLRGVLTSGERAAFALVYWLNPWRLVGAAVLWNPHFLYFLGAAQFATCFDQRERPKFAASLLLALSLGIGAQLHPSVLLLGVLSAILVATRTVRLHWGGAFVGAAAALATLAPWFVAVGERPELFRPAGRVLFASLVRVQPWIKGLHYWLRYPSFAVPEESRKFDFTPLFGAAADRLLTPAFVTLVGVAGVATMLVALLANIEFFRAPRSFGAIVDSGPPDARRFLRRYVAAAALAAVAVFAAAPTTPQSWQGLAIFHAAALPVALWIGRRLDGDRAPTSSRTARRARVATVVAAATAVTLAAAIGVAAPSFRCGGRGDLRYALVEDSPMLHELGLRGACPWPVGVPGGAWPDGLPRGLQSRAGGTNADTRSEP